MDMLVRMYYRMKINLIIECFQYPQSIIDENNILSMYSHILSRKRACRLPLALNFFNNHIRIEATAMTDTAEQNYFN